MSDERSITITNTGNTNVSVVLNYRNGSRTTLELMPGNTVGASLGDKACASLDDVEHAVVTDRAVLPCPRRRSPRSAR